MLGDISGLEKLYIVCGGYQWPSKQSENHLSKPLVSGIIEVSNLSVLLLTKSPVLNSNLSKTACGL